MDHLLWMGAVRMRVQTADKNITILHMTPSVNVFWGEKMCFKLILSELVDNYEQINNLQKQFCSNMLVGFDVRGQPGIYLFTEGSFVMD